MTRFKGCGCRLSHRPEPCCDRQHFINRLGIIGTNVYRELLITAWLLPHIFSELSKNTISPNEVYWYFEVMFYCRVNRLPGDAGVPHHVLVCER